MKRKCQLTAEAAVKTTDVYTRDCGSLVQFILLSDKAKEWVEENVDSEGYQWMGSALCVEHRYAAGLRQGMLDAGLEVS